ncbi:hypothetical protein Z042_24555 [Chania multitudinisentens RB-25]|uniref:Uncharacterized protein n=1 Tax=Chania multitudinisentens RB-25 TaxID=1441930 RepID=W0LKD0_9GAMM|nr:hypothetical protein Z042_24555 [Chania multitudinisentens RB-25]
MCAAEKQHENEPYNSAILHEICKYLVALKREEEMLPWAERALVLNPHDFAFMARRADALYLLGRYAEAADIWAQCLSQQNGSVLYRLRLGVSLMMAGELTRAISLLNEAWRMAVSSEVERAASVGFAMGEAMLKTGDPQGFKYWLMRNDVPRFSSSYRPLGIPIWERGSELRGKRVLITHELGFGDNFLLAACVTDWLAAGAKIMLTCHPQSQALMQASLPNCEVISAPNPTQLHSPLPGSLLVEVNRFAPHIHATLLHLPLLKAGQPEASEQGFQPYLQAPSQKHQIATEWGQQLRARQPGKKLVGLFWDCAQRHWPAMGAVVRCWAQRRSLPLDSVNEIVQYPAVADGVHFVNLHHPAASALAGTPGSNVSVYLPGIRDFSDTAACIAQLDAVIAVDSGVANLAVMMGVLTCVPVHTSGDWRWGVEGTTSPWVKNVTVFRQTHEGDWNQVIQQIREWLLQML